MIYKYKKKIVLYWKLITCTIKWIQSIKMFKIYILEANICNEIKIISVKLY
jgi:hypothetical protein